MHPYRAEISLDMIRDFRATSIQNKPNLREANLEMKRAALEKITDPSPSSNHPGVGSRIRIFSTGSRLYNFERTPRMTTLNREPPKTQRIYVVS